MPNLFLDGQPLDAITGAYSARALGASGPLAFIMFSDFIFARFHPCSTLRNINANSIILSMFYIISWLLRVVEVGVFRMLGKLTNAKLS